MFDFAEPAGYGLGRSGWISCRFGAGEAADLDLLKRWIAESYRAVAPKKLARPAARRGMTPSICEFRPQLPMPYANSIGIRNFMSTHHEFYLERAAEARRDAAHTPLQNVRDRCLRAAEAWEQMAARVERTGRMRAETEAKKAAAGRRSARSAGAAPLRSAQITVKSLALMTGAPLQRCEQDLCAGAVAVGVEEELAGGLIVDDPVVGIGGRGAGHERIGVKRARGRSRRRPRRRARSCRRRREVDDRVDIAARRERW